MRIGVHDANHLVLEAFDEPGLDVEGHLGPMEMFAASLGLCTASVLASYAQVLRIPLATLSVVVRWEYAEDPYRIGRIEMDLDWPDVPPERRKAVLKAAKTCTIHHTLEHPPEVETRLQGGSP